MTEDSKMTDELLEALTTPGEIARVEKSPANLARLAKLVLANDRPARAVALARRALALAPNDGEVGSIASAVLRFSVPEWHFSIVRDEVRNAAYDAALRRHVRPGTTVLEIGTGSGLLAMMAARAGAAKVTSCEVSHPVAAIASDIVAANGFADRVEVIAKHSRELEVGHDLERPADILVSEIVGSNLLGEDVLGCMENTIGRLTRPGGCVIPSHGSIRVALVNYDGHACTGLGVVDGFDLSPFNRLAGLCDLKVGDERLSLRSEAEDLFAFDFSSGGPFDEYRSSVQLVSTGGPVNGVAQWIWLRMDAEGVYESRPSVGSRSCWAVIFYPLASPIVSSPGDRFVVHGRRDRTSVWLWAEQQV
jgi:protein arginine N-methyltransferase 7